MHRGGCNCHLFKDEEQAAKIALYTSHCIGICGGNRTGAKYFVVPGMGVFGYPSFVNTVTKEYQGVIWAVLVSAAALAAGIVCVYLTYKEEESTAGSVEKKKADVNGIIIASPLAGRVIPLGEVKDEAFSSGALGQGAAIVSDEGKLYAPADGVIAALFPTGHSEMKMTNSIKVKPGEDLLARV